MTELVERAAEEVRHPAQYSPEVVAVLAELARPGDRVRAPFEVVLVARRLAELELDARADRDLTRQTTETQEDHR